MTQVAFIGLGHMGLPMSVNLIKNGFDVAGFDLSPDALSAFSEVGGRTCTSVPEVMEGADITITMLTSGAVVNAVYAGDEGIFSVADEETLLIDSSTIDVATTRKLSGLAEEVGFDMVDAPVSGGVAGAEAASLAFMVGGSEHAFERAEHLLKHMGHKVVHCGDHGTGQAAKACNNMLLAISMIGVSEAFSLGRSLGLEDKVFFDVASNASGQCWSLTNYCPVPDMVPTSPANNEYVPGFSAALMLKDLNLAVDAAQKSGAPIPLGAHARAIYDAMNKGGKGDKDFSAVIKHLDIV